MAKLTNIIVSIALILILIMFFFVDFDFSKTIICPIAKQITAHLSIVGISLLVFAIIGLSYKNKKTYFKSYTNVLSIVGYICALSELFSLTHPTKLGQINCISIIDRINYISLIILCVCEIILISLRLFDKCKKNDNSESASRNLLNPIENDKDLFDSRKNQAEIFTNLLSGENNEMLNHGYSICVNGEWGAGKTSFINAVIKKMEDSFEVIRINSMELDCFESLVNYFFGCMKDILKKHGVYVGIASEYKDLVSSLVGTVIHESAGSFLENKFSSDSNYRENLSKLNSLLEKQDFKILVIIDDLERCGKTSNNNALNYLFFIKEIATLDHCICIFLLNYKEFTKVYNIDKSFLDRFFNKQFNLCVPTENDIFRMLMRDNPELEEIYYKYKRSFVEKIQKSGHRSKNQGNNDNYRSKIISQYKTYLNAFKNPRKAGLILEQYKQLNSLVKKYNTNKSAVYSTFLNKVEYKDQMFILSFIYVEYSEEYAKMESLGFSEYMNQFPKESSVNADIKNCLINTMWNSKNSDENQYLMNERHQFIDYLISNPSELPKIANGFTSVQEKYIYELLNGTKPQGVVFSELLSQLLKIDGSNTKFSNNDIARAIEKAFDFYQKDLTLDEVMKCLNSRVIADAIALNDSCFDIIIKKADKLDIADYNECSNSFYGFAHEYIINRISDLTRFTFLLPYHLPTYEIWENIIPSNDCHYMLEKYYNTIQKNLKMPEDKTGNIFNKFKSIIAYVYKAAEECGFSDSADIIEYKANAEKTVKCLQALCEFENDKIIINNKVTPTVFDFTESLNQIQDQLSNYRGNHISADDIERNIYNLMDNTFSEPQEYNSDHVKQIDDLIVNFHKKTNASSINLRKYFFSLVTYQKNKSDNHQTTS